LDGLRITATLVRRFAVIVLLGATFAFSAWLTVYALFHSGEVDVPNVVGMAREDARRAIERAGLVFKPRRIHFDGDTPKDAVTEQDPAAGYPVKAGFEVKVDISKGADPSGADEEQPEPVGPTNPVDQPKDDEKKKEKKKPDNANANANANANTNANTNRATNANANTNAKKPADPKPAEGAPPKPSSTKPKDDPARDDNAPKPKPKTSPKPPPSR
jgi:beta-lactam-binding protein with PASTA domain